MTVVEHRRLEPVGFDRLRDRAQVPEPPTVGVELHRPVSVDAGGATPTRRGTNLAQDLRNAFDQLKISPAKRPDAIHVTPAGRPVDPFADELLAHDDQ